MMGFFFYNGLKNIWKTLNQHYNTILIKDCCQVRELFFEFAKVCVGKNRSMRLKVSKVGTDQFVTKKDFDDLKKDILKEIKKGIQEVPKRWADIVAKVSSNKIGITL